jgi:ferritin-like metal-binding protein YciE
MKKSKNQTSQRDKKSTAQSKTNTSKSSSVSSMKGMSYNGDDAFQNLLEDGLKDILWVEKTLVKELPKMAKKAQSQELREAIEDHLEETREQVQRLTEVFRMIGKSAETKKCDALSGILEEGEKHIGENEGEARDAAIIGSAQKVEHYEIASYGTLCAYANTLGLDDAADLLKETLEEEKAADEKLSMIAETSVNQQAFSESQGMQGMYGNNYGSSSQRNSQYGNSRMGNNSRGSNYGSWNNSSRNGSRQNDQMWRSGSNQGSGSNSYSSQRNRYEGSGQYGSGSGSGYGNSGSGSGYGNSRYGNSGFGGNRQSGYNESGSGDYGTENSRSNRGNYNTGQMGNRWRSESSQGGGEYNQGSGNYGSQSRDRDYDDDSNDLYGESW